MSQRIHKQLAQSGQQLIKLHVLGAAGNVTGSLNLFEYFDGDKVTRFILDAGLHQENEAVNRQNRLPRGITAGDIDFVVISHAHIDHSGFLPKLVKDGFHGTAYTQEATRELIEFMLTDSGYLQEAAADRINRRNERNARSRRSQVRGDSGRSTRRGQSRRQRPPQRLEKPDHVEPLYTEEEARACMGQVKGLQYDRVYTLADGVRVKFTEACHILGAAVVTLEIGKGSKKRTFVFTGNIGRPNTPILRDLAPVAEADYLMSESTYGDKLHEQRNRLDVLADIINRAHARALKPHKKYGYGVIIVPAFAVGRVQAVLYDIRQLMAEKRIPEIPVFVDSPMANKATAVHRKHPELFNPQARKLVESGQDPFTTPRYVEVKDAAQSAQLDQPAKEPVILIGSSGMAAGGRILQHLKKRLPGSQNTVLFVGYQGTGTLGRTLASEEHRPEMVRIFGEMVPVAATIEFMSDYSGHADYSEIVRWLRHFQRKPKNTFLVHGEPESLAALKEQIERNLGWTVTIPRHRQCFVLD